MSLETARRRAATMVLQNAGAGAQAMRVEALAADVFRDDSVAYEQIMTDLMWLTSKRLPVQDPDNFLWSDREDKLRGTAQAATMVAEQQRAVLEEKLLKENMETAMKELAGVMQCSQCKSNRISINQKQSRAADEGMTLYCLCECGHAWKM